MKNLSSFVLCALLMSCSFSKNEKNSATDATGKDSIDSAAYSGGYPFSISGDIRSLPS